MRILVIDDDGTFLVQMEKVLSVEDHSVVTVNSGTAALPILKEDNFDLILMDLKMPGLAGVELIKKIRELGCNSIIMMITGYGTIESAVETTKAGAYDYILKPFDFSKFWEKIKEVEQEIDLRQNLIKSVSIDERGYEEFTELKNLEKYKAPYLIISNTNPSEIVDMLNIMEADTVWLRHEQGENSSPPTKLHRLKTKIEEFVDSHPDGTIFLKGIGPLLTIHQWEEFKRFLIYLQSEVISSNFSLVLLLENDDYFADNSYSALLHNALSVLANPIFDKIIESISHPLRKSVINLLRAGAKLNFNKIVKMLKIEFSSSLAFHMNKLIQESIVEKDDNLYMLTVRGKYLADLIFLLEKL